MRWKVSFGPRVMPGPHNLEAMFAQADAIDLREGLLSYERYNRVMFDLSIAYGVEISRITAAFCALSPNNDYAGNLRSLITLLHGVSEGWPVEEIECSTYRHCLIRAHEYVTGQKRFLDTAKGRKIRSFWHNICTPTDNRFVTVDGHIVAAWRGARLTMKEAVIRKRSEYDEIEGAIKALAFREYIRPNQYQAILWFTRKRIFRIKAELQHDLLLPADDVWKTYRDVSMIKPFPRRRPDGKSKAKAETSERPDLFER